MRKVSKYFAIFFILSLLIFYLFSCTGAPGENSGSTGGNGYTGKIRLNIVLRLPSSYTSTFSVKDLDALLGKGLTSFKDALPISKIYLRLTDSDGVKIHEGDYKPNDTITFEVSVDASKKYTFFAQVYTNASMYATETAIMQGSITIPLSATTKTVYLAVDFLNGSATLNCKIPNNWADEYEFNSIRIIAKHISKGVQKTFEQSSLSATNVTWQLTDAYPGVWEIQQTVTLKNKIQGNTVQYQKTNYLEVYPSIDLPYDVYPSIYGFVRYSKTLNGSASTTPAVAKDGTIYIATSNGWLYAFTDNGTQKWAKQLTTSAIYSGPVIDEDGYIFVGAENNRVYKVNPADGSVVWSFTAGGRVSYGITFTTYSIYFPASDGYLYSVNKVNGQEFWRYNIGTAYFSHPSVAHDGTVYVAAGKLYAFNPDGTIKWTFDGDRSLRYGPSIDSDGTIYVASGDRLYAIKPDGTEKWRTSSYSSYFGDCVIGPNGLIYIRDGGHLSCIDKSNGNIMWRVRPSYPSYNWITNVPLVDYKNHVYVGGDYGYLYVYDGLNGQQLWERDLGDSVYTAPTLSSVGDEKTVLIGVDNKLVSVHTLAKGLANTSWPKVFRDQANTSNVNTDLVTGNASLTTLIGTMPIVPPVSNLSAEYNRSGTTLTVAYQWNYTGYDYEKAKFVIYVKVPGSSLWQYVYETTSRTGVSLKNVWFPESSIDKVGVNVVVDTRQSGLTVCTPTLK
jgi:outer membrane protein assembly factor BamB